MKYNRVQCIDEKVYYYDRINILTKQNNFFIMPTKKEFDTYAGLYMCVHFTKTIFSIGYSISSVNIPSRFMSSCNQYTLNITKPMKAVTKYEPVLQF